MSGRHRASPRLTSTAVLARVVLFVALALTFGPLVAWGLA
jgi:hypothetical protein